MRFSQDFIEKVREANNLVEIISQYTELRRIGDRYTARCPFPDHVEKTPSFSVSETKQVYHCFGCKKSGNLFTFLETFNGMSFREAVEYLAKRASIPLPVDDSRENNRHRETRDILFAINQKAGEHYYQQRERLAPEHPANRYIASRGFSPEMIERFRIGVSVEAWEGLVTFFAQKKIPLPMAEELGLVKRKKERRGGSDYFDLFRERVLFPIFSPSDELLGFGGRTYSNGTPKYLNSPETPIFHKGRVLYGLHETGKFIRSEDHAIIVEGYTDVLALYAAGVKNVAAILGTAFTPDHAKLLKRYTKNVTMLLDGDSAGMNAAERSLPVLLEAGLLVKGVSLPDGLDPDDFIKKNGVDALREELAKAPELFNLVLSRWLREYRGSASEKVRLVTEVYPILKVMENRQLRELYINDMALRLDVEVSWLNRAFADYGRREREMESKNPSPNLQAHGSLVKGPGKPTEPPAGASVKDPNDIKASEPPAVELISVKGAPRDEAFVLSLAVHSETLLQEARDAKVVDVFKHPGIRRAFTWVLERYGQRPEDFDKLAASLASQMDLPNIVTCSFDVTGRSLLKGEPAEKGSSTVDGEAEERRLMTDYINALKKRYLRDQAKALAHQLRDQSNPEMLEQFMNIQKVRHSLDRD